MATAGSTSFCAPAPTPSRPAPRKCCATSWPSGFSGFPGAAEEAPFRAPSGRIPGRDCSTGCRAESAPDLVVLARRRNHPPGWLAALCVRRHVESLERGHPPVRGGGRVLRRLRADEHPEPPGRRDHLLRRGVGHRVWPHVDVLAAGATGRAGLLPGGAAAVHDGAAAGAERRRE